MAPSQSRDFLRIRPILFCLAAALALAAACPGGSRAADFSVSSKTYLLFSERDTAGGSEDLTPLYEYLSGDVRNLGAPGVSFHFYGWGRVDLQDASGGDKQTGELGAAYLQYIHPKGNGEARLGRFFLTEGTASEIVDGAFVKFRTPVGVGFSAYGGVPVEYSITGTEKGDSIVGGRVFFAVPGFLEAGLSYLREWGDFPDFESGTLKDRKLLGGDLWLRPGLPVELSGRFSYNLATDGFASQRYVLRVFPGARIDLSAGYETYAYRDLFQTALNAAFLPPAIDNADEVDAYFALVDFHVNEFLSLEAGWRNIRHDKDDPGDANRGELGARYLYNKKKDVAGLSVAVVSGDRGENEYDEYRAFATFSPGVWRFTLDGLTHRYDEAIFGVKNAYQVVASAGWQALSYLRVAGDVTYTKSPRFDKDYVGLVKVILDFGGSTGGTK